MTETNATSKPVCILVATCIGRAYAYFLHQSDDFFHAYDLHDFNVHPPGGSVSDFALPGELVERCALFLHLTPGWADWGNEPAYRDLLARIPSAVPRISLPYPVFLPLWPFHCADPRNERVNGRLSRHTLTPIHYPYGDASVLSWLRQGRPKDEVIRRCLAFDWAAETDLDGLLIKMINIQRATEAGTDVKIMDYVEEFFRSRRLFLTMNHFGNDLAIYVVDQILEMLGLHRLPAYVYTSVDQLLTPEVPIHPGIIDHFGLTFVRKDHRYRIDPFRTLTFEEYLSHYVEFE